METAKKGIGPVAAVQLLLILLKVYRVISWSWWVVCIPILTWAVIVLGLCLMIGLIMVLQQMVDE